MPLVTDDGRTIAAQTQWARDPFAQLRGLIARRIGEDEALLLPHCAQVHTALLAYPIDVAFCAGGGESGYRLLSVQTLTPWQISRFERGATLAVEMRAGSPLPSLGAGCCLTLR